MNEKTHQSVIVNVYSGAGSAFTVDLSKFNKGEVTFGSGADNDIVVSSPVVSPVHGFFKLTDGGWIICDNRSANGIVVDGAKRNQVKLVNGLEIRIADLQNNPLQTVTMFVEVNDSAAAEVVNEKTAEKASVAKPPKKKKSKAPIVIVIVLVILLLLGGLGILIFGGLGLLGFGAYSFLKPHGVEQQVENTIEDYSEVVSVESDDVAGIETEAPVETEIVTEHVGDLPPIVPENIYCEQFILAETKDTYATLTLYQKENGVWVKKLTADGRIGKNGITEDKHEGDGCTPAGEFDLTFCCGVTYPDTNLDFEYIYMNSVWVDDVNSSYYNTLQLSDYYYQDWDSAEPMYDSYFKNNRHNYCINIAANGDGITSYDAIPGAGSVITLCGKNDTLTATQGCIDISGEDMIALLHYLDSSMSPSIIIY